MKKKRRAQAAPVDGAAKIEAEALRLCYEAREGRRVEFTGAHAVALQDFYRKLLDTGNLRGLCLEGNHP